MKSKIGSKEVKKEPIVEENKPKKQIKDLTVDDLKAMWAKMTLMFNDSEPIIAMCCAKAQRFEVVDNVLNIGFEYGTNMLVVDSDKNKEIMLNELFKDTERIPTKFYLLDKPVDEVKIKIDRLKSVFDKNILKITKK